MRVSSIAKVGSRTYYFLLLSATNPVHAQPGWRFTVDPDPADRYGRLVDLSPHSTRTIVLRILGALGVIVIAFAVQRLWLSDEAARNTFGAKIDKIEIESNVLDRSMPVSVVVPRRTPTKDRRLLIFLHGRNDDERSYLVDPMFEALADLRDRAPVVAFPYGGASSYWHNRDSGQWAEYVLSELIPKLIRRYDISPRKIAIGGISMGGYGAYDIARLSPERFCAIGAHSPAIWESAGETADGAFDDAADFERNDIIAAAKLKPNPYRGTRLWIDAGDGDPFLAGDEAFEDALRSSGLDPIVRNGSGGHDSGYWNGNWREYFGFYARALNNCPVSEKTTGSKQPAGGEPNAGP
jgi:S-formylglutathione hydrolase FrmB